MSSESAPGADRFRKRCLINDEDYKLLLRSLPTHRREKRIDPTAVLRDIGYAKEVHLVGAGRRISCRFKLHYLSIYLMCTMCFQPKLNNCLPNISGNWFSSYPEQRPKYGVGMTTCGATICSGVPASQGKKCSPAQCILIGK